MEKVYICYDEQRTGGALRKGSDWYHKDVYIDYKIIGAALEKPDGLYYETWEIDLPTKDSDIYIVVVRFKSGSTFGSSYGNGAIAHVGTELKEVQKIAKSINDNTYTGRASWRGYFDQFESVSVVVTNLTTLPSESYLIPQRI